MHTVVDLYYFNYDSEVKITLSRVVINTGNWRQVRCRCRMFQKEYMLVHVLGLSIRLDQVICPQDAIDIALQKKRSRGAPLKKLKETGL